MNLGHFVNKQQRQGDVTDVVAETRLEDVTTRSDDWMSRRQLDTSAAHRVIGDEVKDDVDFRQV